jgi:flagellar hook-length control protein FliK
LAVLAQPSGMPAARGSTAAARGSAPRAAAGQSPAAQALAPKKASGFLQLFRRIAGAGGKALPAGSPAPAASATGQGTVRGKSRSSEADEFRAQAAEARAGRKPRRAGRQALPGLGGAEAPAAPARRSSGAPSQEAVAATEARSAARPAQARVIVVDLRTRAVRAQAGAGRQAELPERGEAPAEGRESPRGLERVAAARESGSPAPGSALTPGSQASTAAPGGPAPGSPALLSGQALRERLLPEIVHQAGIILRDGGEGEIRLVLKPENLGSVRIRLQLGESSLEGRIVVDNSNVKELLDAHLEQLKSALRQEGYASANIDVTVSGGGGERRDPPPEPVLAAVSGRTAGEFERAATPALLDLGFTTVNLLA